MSVFSLKAVEEEDYDTAKRKVIVSSVIAITLYAALTGWRYESTVRLKEGLEDGETIVGSEITAFFSSSVWLEANYGVVFGLALFTFFFALLGVYQKSREMMSFLCCCSGCCGFGTFAFIITTLVVGPLCESGIDCSDNQARQAGTAILLIAIMVVYVYIWYWSLKLYKTQGFFVQEETRELPTYSSAPPKTTNQRPQPPTITESQLESVPFAIPVPQS